MQIVEWSYFQISVNIFKSTRRRLPEEVNPEHYFGATDFSAWCMDIKVNKVCERTKSTIGTYVNTIGEHVVSCRFQAWLRTTGWVPQTFVCQEDDLKSTEVARRKVRPWFSILFEHLELKSLHERLFIVANGSMAEGWRGGLKEWVVFSSVNAERDTLSPVI